MKKSLPIFVFDPFTSEMSLNAVWGMLYYEKNYGEESEWYTEEERKDFVIKMYINSPGGYVTDLMAIIDTMNNVKMPVETYCIGQASSCAAVLLSNGSKGKRFIGKNSSVLLHQVSAAAFGHIKDVDIAVKQAKALNEQIISILAKNTKKSKTQIKEDLDRDLYLNAKEALEYGIVDVILEDNTNELKAMNKDLDKKAFLIGETIEVKAQSCELEKKELSFEVKSVKEKDNEYVLEGYAAAFSNVDLVNDIIHPGAFARTLKTSNLMSNSNDRVFLCSHNTEELPIGKATLTEDNYGLKVIAVLPKDDTFVSGRVIPQLRVGSIQKMSMGYKAIEKYFKGGTRNLTDIELYEVSIVPIAANGKANIESVKSALNNSNLESITDVSRFLKEKGLTKSEVDDVVYNLKTILTCNAEEENPWNAEKVNTVLDNILENLKVANTTIKGEE